MEVRETRSYRVSQGMEHVEACWNGSNELPTIPLRNLTTIRSSEVSERQVRHKMRLLLKEPSIRGLQPLSADSPDLKRYLRGRQPLSAGLLTQRHNLLCQEGQIRSRQTPLPCRNTSETQSIVSGGADPLSADPFTLQKHLPGN